MLAKHDSANIEQFERLPKIIEVVTGVFLPNIRPPNTKPDIKWFTGFYPQILDSNRHDNLYENTNKPKFLAC